jgi:hypothetical protein
MAKPTDARRRVSESAESRSRLARSGRGGHSLPRWEVRGDRGRVDVGSMGKALDLPTMRTSEMDDATRESVVRLCIDAHHEEDFRNLFSSLPPEALHVLAYLTGVSWGTPS